MIKVHHLNQSRSTRVLWLLEELKLPYEVVHHERDPHTRLAPASLGQVHPLNKAPAIEHNGLVLCESGAIMEYLLDLAESTALRPAKSDTHYYQYLEWLHFAEGSLALPVITTLLLGMEQREGSAPMDGYIAKELALDLSYIEATLSQQTFFAGPQFSAADIMMTITLEFAANLKLLDDKPQIQRYLNQVQSREAYQAARKQG